MAGVFNTVKNGSTVPVKFAGCAGDTKVTDTSKVAFSAAKVTCATGAVEVAATGATSLRYDSTAGQFVYNWATPQTAGACYALTMTTADGTATKALFKLKQPTGLTRTLPRPPSSGRGTAAPRARPTPSPPHP